MRKLESASVGGKREGWHEKGQTEYRQIGGIENEVSENERVIVEWYYK